MRAWRGISIYMGLICFLCGMSFCPAWGGFFAEHARGWHWYEEMPSQGDEAAKDPTAKPPSGKPPSAKADPTKAAVTPGRLLKRLKKNLEERLHAALMFPTHGNIRAYMGLQHTMVQRAALFSRRWMETLAYTPAMDDTLRFPVTHMARPVYEARQRQRLTARIRALAQSHGLFLFVKGDCPYCPLFVPIVKRFATHHGWALMIIAMDDQGLKEHPGAHRDNGTAARLGVTVFPTLLAVHPSSGTTVPLSHGFSTQDQMDQRLHYLLERTPHAP